MFELKFAEKINSDIVSVLKYISEDENIVLLYRFLYCRRDWINILTDDMDMKK